MRGSAGAGGFERLRVVMSLGLPAMVLGWLCFRDPHPFPLPAALRLQGEGKFLRPGGGQGRVPFAELNQRA